MFLSIQRDSIIFILQHILNYLLQYVQQEKESHICLDQNEGLYSVFYFNLESSSPVTCKMYAPLSG